MMPLPWGTGIVPSRREDVAAAQRGSGWLQAGRQPPAAAQHQHQLRSLPERVCLTGGEAWESFQCDRGQAKGRSEVPPGRFLLVLPRAVLGLASFTPPALRVLLHCVPQTYS